MSIGFVQLGQCGNQIGQCMLEQMQSECQSSSPGAQALMNETFFFEKSSSRQCAKALLIDMEPKVVERCLKSDYYDRCQLSITKQEGSGNNWAYGYNIHGPSIANDLCNRMDVLLESAGYLEALFFISSLAGGTGSGLGSYALELMADRYPEIELFNICVVPHMTGEVILQSLNATLTIASLYQNSNAIILLNNDDAQQLCNHLLNLKSPSLADINGVMSTNLASFFWPALTQSVYSTFQNNIQYVQNLLSITTNQYKFLQIAQIPQLPQASKAFQNDNWSSLEKRINQMMATGAKEHNINWHRHGQSPYKSLLISRGLDVKKHDWKDSVIVDEHQFNRNEKSLTALYNSPNITGDLNTLADRANQMFQEKAYIYQYEKFGVSQEMFLESLCIFEGIIADYELLNQ